jgi:hypothetical protein
MIHDLWWAPTWHLTCVINICVRKEVWYLVTTLPIHAQESVFAEKRSRRTAPSFR